MAKPIIRKHIQKQLILYFVAVVILIVNTIGLFLYFRAEHYFDIEMGKKLEGVAEAAADLIDADMLIFIKPGLEDGRFYKTIRRTLFVLMTDFKADRIYIIDKSDRILVDTDSNGLIGDVIPYLNSNLPEIKSVQDGNSIYSTLYRGESGNLFKSAYAPVINSSNEITAIVGVDASPAFLKVIDDIRESIIIINLISLFIAIAFGVFFSKLIVNPINKLVKAARRVSLGDLTRPIENLPNNEIGYLGEVFDSMQENLKNKEQSLLKLQLAAEQRANTIKTYNDYILQSINNGIITIDKAQIVTVFNDEARKLLNIKSKQCIGKNLFKVINKNHPIRSMLEIKITQIPRLDFFETTLGFNDIERSISVQLSPLFDAASNVIGTNLVITDLTEIYSLQEKMKNQEKLAYLGQLSATIAHEIRNPLNSMELFMGLLQRQVSVKDKKNDIISRVEQEIKNLNTIITEFLQFAKPAELEIESVQISKIVNMALFLIEDEKKKKKIKIVKNIDKNYDRIKGDFNQLKQAFLNLFKNAVHAIEYEGILTIDSSLFSENSDYIEIKIKDTGCGMGKVALGKAFDPFYSTRSQGTGLGLTIVNNIIESHKGKISVKSKIGEGSTFIIKLSIRGFADE
ncbi:MAG: HAMP domain-containing protein [Planctomycetia bacterium]|nr:HAMP domain-containing protein [Planctomycetia bacterium]